MVTFGVRRRTGVENWGKELGGGLCEPINQQTDDNSMPDTEGREWSSLYS